MLQACWDELSPTQSNPPLTGSGLLHSLDLCWIPPPHVTLQAVQLDHVPQLPSKRGSEKCSD